MPEVSRAYSPHNKLGSFHLDNSEAVGLIAGAFYMTITHQSIGLATGGWGWGSQEREEEEGAESESERKRASESELSKFPLADSCISN